MKIFFARLGFAAVMALQFCLIQSAHAGSWSTNGTLNTARYSHTSTLLQNGKVLVAGGYNTGYLSSAELFDPATGISTATASMTTNRSQHTATLLQNGKVLVAGGYLENGFGGITLSSAELYDPISGTWTPTGSMTDARAYHTATLLPDGKVLVAAGLLTTNFTSTYIGSSEIYDPATGLWTPTTNSLTYPRLTHTATLLANGKVLVVGGNNTNTLVSAELFDPATGSWSSTGSLKTNRHEHTATLLPDGRVLAVGGYSSGTPTASAELYNPANGTWTVTTSMVSRRYNHSAALLPNGTVLVAGGTYSVSTYASSEIYNPANGTWTTNSGSMVNVHASATATVLPTGRVLIAAGYYLSGFDTTPTAAMDVYEPAAGSWAATSDMSTPRFATSAILLPNGKVLLAGGYVDTSLTQTNGAELYDFSTVSWTNTGAMAFACDQAPANLLPNGKVLVAHGKVNGDTNGAELYDPNSGTWSAPSPVPINGFSTTTLLTNGSVLAICGAAGTNTFPTNSAIYNFSSNTWTVGRGPNAPRALHTATLLQDGRVLVAGGKGLANDTLASAELYDPTLGTWTNTQSLSFARYNHTATLLPNGKVLVAGGQYTNFVLLSSAEVFDPQTGTWTTVGSMNNLRLGHTMTLLPNGKVLVTGGTVDYSGFFSQATYTNSTELFDPITGTWTTSAPLLFGRGSHAATLLPNGKVLIAGGRTNSSSFLYGPAATAELYDAGLGYSSSWQPQISASLFSLGVGGRVALTGSRFRGVSEASIGTGQDSATDYPIVQLRSIESGISLFVPATSWTTNSFTSTTLPIFPVGYVFETVYVNGIPSAANLLPFNATPSPVAIFLAGAKKTAGGLFQLSFTNTPGATFTVLSSTNCTPPASNWPAVGSVTEVSPGNFQFTDSQAATNSRRFYEVRSP